MSYEKFDKLLRARNATVYRVSKETGIPASTFSDWKTGRSTPKAEKLKKIARFFDVSLEYFLDGEADGYISPEKNIPIIGEIRAGSPIITNETLLGYEKASVDSADNYFYLRICGDSMKNIGMVNGSLVLFRKQQYAEEGDIVACLVGGDSATVKRFRRNQKNIYLVPENDDYKPIKLSTDDFEAGDARILGVAVEIKIKL
ncbi:MAG: helix-turn-helix domain-containing protein [Clostridia bacterium]|nr:helix-turn-helix domain-containing protein [Clostridia bacterium]MBQ8850807.1 helix-turn-helix domain-containing protein [Clostridia bacterium]